MLSKIISTILVQLCKTDISCIVNMWTIVVIMLIMIITTPIILHLVLATNVTNLSDNMTTIQNKSYNSFTLLPSNQSTSKSSLLEKNNVTLEGLFDNLGGSGDWNQLLQPALDELNSRHPDMNIRL